MPTFFYTGNLTDIGVHVLAPNYTPRLTVRPEVEAFGPDGVVSGNRVVVDVSATGAFTMELVASHQLTGADGRSGVRYVLELVLFGESFDGTKFPSLHEQWKFSAIAGGGPIAEMGEVPPVALYIGPPWPARKAPGAYFSPKSGWFGTHRIGA